MVHRNKVVRSIETPCGTRCIDIFRTDAGLFGFAEYRRDPEDPTGWHQTGATAECWPTEAQALAEAERRTAWLREVIS